MEDSQHIKAQTLLKFTKRLTKILDKVTFREDCKKILFITGGELWRKLLRDKLGKRHSAMQTGC